MSEQGHFVGIDFGSSTCKASWINPNTKQAEIIYNSEAATETPSVIHFGPEEILVGAAAERKLEEEAQRKYAIIHAKKFLGSQMLLSLPGNKSISPREVAAEIIGKLKRDLEEFHFREEVTRVVISCPAIFTQLARDTLRDAATSAGFQEVKLIEEPVAVARAWIAAGFTAKGNLIVFDLGGSSCTIDVLAADENRIQRVMTPEVIDSCGGDLFDRILYDHVLWLAQHALNQPIHDEDGTNARLLHQCRRFKEHLTTHERCDVSVTLRDDTNFNCNVERNEFIELIADRVQESVRMVRRIAERERQRGYPIAHLLLAGSSSRMPIVKQLIENEKELGSSLELCHGTHFAALGAASYGRELWSDAGNSDRTTAATPKIRTRPQYNLDPFDNF